MNEERLLVLRMLSEGRISPEEAGELLDALEIHGTKPADKPNSPYAPELQKLLAKIQSIGEKLTASSPSAIPVPPVAPVPIREENKEESEREPNAPESPKAADGEVDSEDTPCSGGCPQKDPFGEKFHPSHKFGPKHIHKMHKFDNLEHLGEKISADIISGLKDLRNAGAEVIASIPPIHIPDIKESIINIKNAGPAKTLSQALHGKSIAITKEIELFPGDTVKVENIAGDISIIAADTKSLSLNAELFEIPEIPFDKMTEECHLKAERSGNTVSLSIQIPSHGDLKRPPLVDYCITVPRWVQIYANSVEGDIKIKGVEEPIFLSTVNGDVTAEECSGEVKAESVSGDINIQGAKGKHITSSSVSGDINVCFAEVVSGTKASMKTVSGDINVSVPESACVRYYCKTFSGDISFSKSVEYEASDSKNVITVYNGSSSEFRLETLSGDINC